MINIISCNAFHSDSFISYIRFRRYIASLDPSNKATYFCLCCKDCYWTLFFRTPCNCCFTKSKAFPVVALHSLYFRLKDWARSGKPVILGIAVVNRLKFRILYYLPCPSLKKCGTQKCSQRLNHRLNKNVRNELEYSAFTCNTMEFKSLNEREKCKFKPSFLKKRNGGIPHVWYYEEVFNYYSTHVRLEWVIIQAMYCFRIYSR